jgi:murein DD-endopeptidase MepM/ murein hydrolase activator NlpD
MSYFEDNIKRILAKNETYENIGYHLAKLLADSFLDLYEIKQEADPELANCFKNEITNLIRSYKVEDYQKIFNDKIHLKNFIKDLAYLLNNSAKLSALLKHRTNKYIQQLDSSKKRVVQEKIEKKINLPFYCQESIEIIEKKLQHETEVKKTLLNLKEFKYKDDKEFVLSLAEILNLEQDTKSLEIQLVNLNSSLEALILMRVDLDNLKNISQDKWEKYLGLNIKKEQTLKLSILINDYYKDKELEFINEYQNITTLAKNKEIDHLDFADEENLEKLRGLINYGNVELAVNSFLSNSGKTQRRKFSNSSQQPTPFSHQLRNDGSEEGDGKKRGSYLSDSEIKKHIDQQIKNPEFVAHWQNLSIGEQQNIWDDLKRRNYNVLPPVTSEFDKKSGIEYLEMPPDDIFYRYLREIDNESKLIDPKTKENKNLISHFNEKEKQTLIQNLPEDAKQRLKEKTNIDFDNTSLKDIENALGYLEPSEVAKAIKQNIFNQEKHKLINEDQDSSSTKLNQPIQHSTRNFTPGTSPQNSQPQKGTKDSKPGSYDYTGPVGQISEKRSFHDQNIETSWNNFSDQERREVYQYARIGVNAGEENSIDGISMGNLTPTDVRAYQNHKKEIAKIKQSKVRNLSNQQIKELSQKLNISPNELKSENGAKKVSLEAINQLSTKNKEQNISKSVINKTVSIKNFNSLSKKQKKLLITKKKQEQEQSIKELKKELSQNENLSETEINVVIEQAQKKFNTNFAPQLQTKTPDVANLENDNTGVAIATGASINSNGKSPNFLQRIKQKAGNSKFLKKFKEKSVKKLEQKATGTAIKAATSGIPGLNVATAGLTAFQALFDKEKREELKKTMQIIAGIGAAIVAALMALFAMIGAVITGAVIGAIIGGILGSFFGPGGTIIGASIGGTVGGASGFFWDKIKLGFHNMIGSAGNFFSSLWGNVAGFFKSWFSTPVVQAVGAGGAAASIAMGSNIATQGAVNIARGGNPVSKDTETSSLINGKYFDFGNNSFKFNKYLIGQIEHKVVEASEDSSLITYSIKLEKRNNKDDFQIKIKNATFVNHFNCSKEEDFCPKPKDLTSEITKQLNNNLINSKKIFNIKVPIRKLNNSEITAQFNIDFDVLEEKESTNESAIVEATQEGKTKIIDLSIIENNIKEASKSGEVKIIENEKLKLSNTICLGNCIFENKFCWPTSGTITQLPFGGFSHQTSDAYDVANGVGEPIFSPNLGQVRYFLGSSCGNGAYLTMSNGEKFLFCHMLKRQTGVKDIQQGDLIGLMGSTGWSTGSHLHYEIRPGGPSLIKSNMTKYLPEESKYPRVGQKIKTCFFNR